MCGRKVEKLGGQDRRWLKVSSLLFEKYKIDALINQSYLEVAEKTELKISGQYKEIKEATGKYSNYLKLNFNVCFYAIQHKHIHYCANALEMLPSAIIMRYLFRKTITFSFNGVSVDYLKSTNQWKSVLILRIMNRISKRIEILNPRLINENFFNEKKTFVSRAMYAGSCAITKKNINNKKIVFSGHLYALKGIENLLKIIESCPDSSYEFYIYGAKTEGDKTNEIENLISHLKNFINVRLMDHINDMSEVYADALVVLSLQTVSNYPSQVVMEGLAAGAAVLMTDTGDSRQFGEIPGIFYVNPEFDEKNYWATIKYAANYSAENHQLISKSCMENFNPEAYAENFFKEIRKT